MISIVQAAALVREHTGCNAAWRCPVRRAVGRVLAEDVTRDLDSPPFDKSTVDGYAVHTADLQDVPTSLEISDRILAGRMPQQPLPRGRAAQVMTGAPLPPAADAVVMQEYARETEVAGVTQVRIEQPDICSGQNLLPRGSCARRGDLVVRRGTRLRPVDVGVLSEAGRSQVRVVRPARVSIIATGDELVAPDEQPGAGQIRNTNSALLAALARAEQAAVRDLGICRDERDRLQRVVQRGLDSEVLLLSGGVSVGVRDLVPSVLRDLGVRQVFHRVFLKPGKPLWFGVAERSSTTTLVFGLPGNPVGSLVCFTLFVRPALQRLGGHQECDIVLADGTLATDHAHRSDRPTFAPAATRRHGSQYLVTPVPWQGSADISALSGANSLVLFPPGDQRYPTGTSIKFTWLDNPGGEIE